MCEWTREWPNKEGVFWFYGYRYGKICVGCEVEKELCLVRARKISNGFACTTEGQFMFKSEIEDAYFKKAELPELPRGA